MTNLEYKMNITNIVYLCSCAVNGIKPDKERIMGFDLEALFDAAQKHMLAAMIGIIIDKEGISSRRFANAIAMAQRKAVILKNDLTNVTSKLESAGIWYMPLKGAILQDYYPAFAMREMADIDILFDRTRDVDVKDLMESLGFETKCFQKSNDDDYVKPPVSNFEMHRLLFGDHHDKKLYMYYKNVKDRLLKDVNNNYGYHFSPEDYYVFMIAHSYKHFNMGGTGLRSVLDTYIYIQNNTLNMDYIEKETSKLGISEYEQENRELAVALFSGKELSNRQQMLFEYIIASGAFGTIRHSVENRLLKSRAGKAQYLKRRLFGPAKNDQDRKQFERSYALFFRYPFLFPLLPCYRLFRALRVNPKRIKIEVESLIKAEQKKYKETGTR